jgi:hypothetical protein
MSVTLPISPEVVLGAIACDPSSQSFYSQRFEQFVRLPALSVEELPSLEWQRDDTEVEFNKFAAEWRAQKLRATSFFAKNATHPAYQHIIGMGKRVLPFILRELKKGSDDWFWALKAISGDDPVSIENRGKLKEMRDAWLRWGREKNYAR